MVAVDIRNDGQVVELLQEVLEDAESLDQVVSIRSFADVGLLTRDAGLVVRMENGAEFQITVQRSMRAIDAASCMECGRDLGSRLELVAHLVEDHEMEPEDAQEAVA